MGTLRSNHPKQNRFDVMRDSTATKIFYVTLRQTLRTLGWLSKNKWEIKRQMKIVRKEK